MSESALVPTLTLYTREGCHLCEDALALIERMRPGLPAFTLRVCDISLDERLHDAYFDRIPVLALDGVELGECVIYEEDLTEALAGERHPLESQRWRTGG